jgi:peptide/nickel transport system permease protein
VTLIGYGGTMLLMRTSMLETLREDYILTARAKGLPDKTVRDKHAARNALLPVWTSLVFSIGGVINGGIITETIFSWPGIGLTLLKAATSEDIPVAMGVFTILGVMTLVSHLVADIGYAFLDPRIRYH